MASNATTTSKPPKSARPPARKPYRSSSSTQKGSRAEPSSSTAGRWGDRRYRLATNHSNRIVVGRIRYAPCASEAEDDSPPPSGRSSGNRITSRMDGEPVDPDSFARRWRHAMAQCADVIQVQLLRHFIPALRHLRQKPALLLGGIVQLRKPVRHLHPGNVDFKSLG